MDVVHLHPEDLLDRDRAGARDPRVAAHLAACEACRWAEQLRRDFADEAGSVRPHATSDRPARPAWRRAAAGLALGLATLAAFVAAGAAASSDDAGERRAAASEPRERAPHATTGIEPRDALRIATPLAPTLANTRAPARAPDRDEASAWFREAGALRRGGAHADARRLYESLLARHAATPEARAASVIVARMRLDARDAAGALPLFEAYLASGDGGMREEALAGRALALDASARADEGREAWLALLRSFPGSGYAAHAIARVRGGEPLSAR